MLSNQGALVKHWYLKKYNDNSGKPLDLVQPQAAAHFGLPLSLFTYPDSPVSMSQLNQALYQTTVNGQQASGTTTVLAPATVAFHYAQNGVDVVKTIQFDSSYVISVSNEVKRDGQPVRALIQWPAGPGPPPTSTRSTTPPSIPGSWRSPRPSTASPTTGSPRDDRRPLRPARPAGPTGAAWDREVWSKSRIEAVFLTNEFDDPLTGWDTAQYIPCLRTDDLVLKLHEPRTVERLGG